MSFVGVSFISLNAFVVRSSKQDFTAKPPGGRAEGAVTFVSCPCHDLAAVVHPLACLSEQHHVISCQHCYVRPAPCMRVARMM